MRFALLGSHLSAQQVASRNLERLGETLHNSNRRVARSTLDIADVGPVYPGFMGERFLTELHLAAQATHIPAEAFSDIHAITKTPLSTNDLQTMSDMRR